MDLSKMTRQEIEALLRLLAGVLHLAGSGYAGAAPKHRSKAYFLFSDVQQGSGLLQQTKAADNRRRLLSFLPRISSEAFLSLSHRRRIHGLTPFRASTSI
jgi:hypothetical protein